MARQLSLAAALLATQVAAHGYINTFTLDGVDHEGFSMSNPSPDPNAIGWSFTTPDEGPEVDFSSPDFVCRRGAEPASNYGTVAAGGTASFFWTSDDKVINPDGWSQGHRGPIITYIAPCNGDCASVDKTSLRWTKIAESGLVSGPANTQGTWATDVLRENGGINEATIPASIAPGKYVIRNEIIALHRAHINEPEFYMQCGNIEVTGDGTDDLSGSGVAAGELYSQSDSQLFGFSVHDSQDNEWPIPGPPLYAGQSGQSQASPKPSPSPSPQESRRCKRKAAAWRG
ncbi:glycosyl hydrolase family 61-domain-containing protein [Chaetomium sp. MPI-CAGE-AT-0009]|nr:glycosyl hydrolase family 61-domain-containing protein [Chaetomium sp. MPI-CAGE-AT-0009]